MAGTPVTLTDETGIERFRGTQDGGGGSQPWQRKTLTYADFVAGSGTTAPFTLADGDVLIGLGVQVPVAFDDTGAANGLGINVGTFGNFILAIDLSSDTTTNPGFPVFGYMLPVGTAGGAPGIPCTGGVSGPDITVALSGFANDGNVGTLVVIAGIVTPTDLP